MLFNNSDELCQHVADISDGLCILSFSGGKDSLACWLQLQKYFDRIIPFYMYLVPGLSFVEQGLSYYEDVFKTRIIRLPHPSLYRMLNNFTFQAPENCQVIADLALPNFDYDDLYRVIKEDYSLPDNVYTALGVRAVDSPNRWAAMKKYGPLNEKRQVFYPIYDWRKAQLMGAINQAGSKLPPDYVLLCLAVPSMGLTIVSWSR